MAGDNVTVTTFGPGKIASSDDYDVWGMVWEGRSTNNGQPDARYKFTGNERDTETGNDYFGARYYDPRIGRFLTLDRFASMYPGMSPYLYAANNPVLFIDINGDSTVQQQPSFWEQWKEEQYGPSVTERIKAMAKPAGADKTDATSAKTDPSTNEGPGILQGSNPARATAAVADRVSTATTVLGVGAAIGSLWFPPLAVVAVDMLSVSMYANAVSTVSKGVDWTAYDGTSGAFYEQLAVTGVSAGGGLGLKWGLSKLVASSGVIGPTFRNSLNGQFISNRIGYAAQALPDVTSTYVSYRIMKMLDAKK